MRVYDIPENFTSALAQMSHMIVSGLGGLDCPGEEETMCTTTNATRAEKLGLSAENAGL